MKIAMAASEAAPFLKTGGLGDVMEALPQALAQIPKNEVSVFLPFYGAIKYDDRFEKEFLGYFDVPLAWRREYVGVFRLKSRKKKLKISHLQMGKKYVLYLKRHLTTTNFKN